ncbi:MAG: hypothetical protein FWD38_00685 [Oscillospiraceae bacterium]|nr:hypothetical protein [Oscillospiraceae bacterium]
MKKILTLILVLLMLSFVLFGCSTSEDVPITTPDLTPTETPTPEPTPQPTPEPTPEPINSHKVSFNPNGGSWEDGSDVFIVKVEDGATLGDLLPDEPKLRSQSFYGWVLSTTELFDVNKVITEDVELIAVWVNSMFRINQIARIEQLESFIVDENGIVDLEFVIDDESFLIDNVVINIRHIGNDGDTTILFETGFWTWYYLSSDVDLVVHEGATLEITMDNDPQSVVAGFTVHHGSRLINYGTIILNPDTSLQIGLHWETPDNKTPATLINEGNILINGGNTYANIGSGLGKIYNKGIIKTERGGLALWKEVTFTNDGTLILGNRSTLRVEGNSKFINNGTLTGGWREIHTGGEIIDNN